MGRRIESFNESCNELADHMISTQAHRSAERIARLEQESRSVRSVFGDKMSDSVRRGSSMGVRMMAALMDDMDEVVLGIFILGAKLSGGRKINQ